MNGNGFRRGGEIEAVKLYGIGSFWWGLVEMATKKKGMDFFFPHNKFLRDSLRNNKNHAWTWLDVRNANKNDKICLLYSVHRSDFYRTE